MSINYFLFCKKKYEYIISHINEIIDLHTEIINESYDYLNDTEESSAFTNNSLRFLNDVAYLNEKRHSYIEEKKQLKEKLTYFKKLCEYNCRHNFVTDEIEINDERSQIIEYCTICEYTKPY
jgi:hypothetical protein